MPGVLIVEAMAQASALLSLASMGKGVDDKTVYYFVGIDAARFKRPVLPGDTLRIESEQLRMSRGMAKFKARALVDGQLATEAELLCALRPIE